MNHQEYARRVKVLLVPHLEGPVTPDSCFHLATHGLSKHYLLPELEMVAVPAPYVEAAQALLNRWATYQIETGRRIKAGERLSGQGSILVYRAELSPDPPKGRECLRLILDHIHFQCGCCGGRGEVET